MLGRPWRDGTSRWRWSGARACRCSSRSRAPSPKTSGAAAAARRRPARDPDARAIPGRAAPDRSVGIRRTGGRGMDRDPAGPRAPSSRRRCRTPRPRALCARRARRPGVPEPRGFDVPPGPPGRDALRRAAGDAALRPQPARRAPHSPRSHRPRLPPRRAPRAAACCSPMAGPRDTSGCAWRSPACCRPRAGWPPPRTTCASPGAARWRCALLARALVRPGDVVAVEELSYRAGGRGRSACRGRRWCRCRSDAEGLQIEPLEKLARAGRLRAVHVTPHHQFPTTVTLSAARRLRLLELARTHRFAMIEEDYDHEFHFDGRPGAPAGQRGPLGRRGLRGHLLEGAGARAADRLRRGPAPAARQPWSRIACTSTCRATGCWSTRWPS